MTEGRDNDNIVEGLPPHLRMLSIDEATMGAIHDLRLLASAETIDASTILRDAETVDGMLRLRDAMTRRTIIIPDHYRLTYSVERQPCGLCRHLSVSVGEPAQSLLPHPGALRILGGLFGFMGSLADWMVWEEKSPEGLRAVNVLQPIAVGETATSPEGGAI